MTSIFNKRWVQDVSIYGGIGLFVALIIYGVVQGVISASDPVTSGEVHWHSPISYEACGKELSFNDERGHTITHGHNDGVVHIEGTILKEDDITLAGFFKNAGINITSTNLDEFKNGDLCNFSSDPGAVVFYVDGEAFSDPNEIIIQDKQEILVKFE